MSRNNFTRLYQNYRICNRKTCKLPIQVRCYTAGEKYFKDYPLAGTVAECKQQLAKIMGVQPGYKPLPANRSHLKEYLPASQEELPPRTMKDSLTSALVPLSTDLALQDKYITFLGNVRLGRLLEDMDVFAVYVAQMYILNPKLPEGKPSPHTLVTVLVDQIDFTNYLSRPDADIKLSGHVSWVGNSSIEVVVWLEQQWHGEWQKITKAVFIVAARDPTNEKAAPVNPLIVTTDQEKTILAGAEVRKKRRTMFQSQHLTRTIPTVDEQKLMHELYLRTLNIKQTSLKKRILPPGSIWMENCTLSNMIFSQPEDRNLHNKIFGGFLMRQANELSLALGFLFSKYRPQIKSISDINFNEAINVNTLIRMNAHVVFTHMQYFQIVVYAETWETNSGKHRTTNSFHFTYEVPEVVPEVFPQTYDDTMMYIDGRRHFYKVMTELSADFKPYVYE